jgi:GTP cyclohydrolase I
MYQAANMPSPSAVLGIPRGGMAVAYRIAWEMERRHPELVAPVVDAAPSPEHATDGRWRACLIVDDIVDSGATIAPYAAAGLETMSLIVRDASGARPKYYGRDLGGAGQYVEFPWDEVSGTPESSITRIIEFLGRDPLEPALKDTPRRFLDMLRELTELNDKEVATTTFDHDGDDLIIVKDIPFYSLCEHHIMAYGGVAHIGYLPKAYEGHDRKHSKILGLSKFARIVAKEAAGLTTQERVTSRVARAVAEGASSPDVAVVTEATHSCMILRGAKAFGSSTTSATMLGQFRTEASLRAEFYSLLR